MNNTTPGTKTIEAKKISSLTLREFIEAGGEITKLESIYGSRPDDAVHVFTCEGRDGTYTSDNACVSWYDATFDRVLESLQSGDVSDLPDSHAIATI